MANINLARSNYRDFVDERPKYIIYTFFLDRIVFASISSINAVFLLVVIYSNTGKLTITEMTVIIKYVFA
jgi:hypothetical protein